MNLFKLQHKIGMTSVSDGKHRHITIQHTIAYSKCKLIYSFYFWLYIISPHYTKHYNIHVFFLIPCNENFFRYSFSSAIAAFPLHHLIRSVLSRHVVEAPAEYQTHRHTVTLTTPAAHTLRKIHIHKWKSSEYFHSIPLFIINSVFRWNRFGLEKDIRQTIGRTIYLGTSSLIGK